MPVNSWFNLIISGTVAGILGFVLNIFLFLNKEDREIIKILLKKDIYITKKEQLKGVKMINIDLQGRLGNHFLYMLWQERFNIL